MLNYTLQSYCASFKFLFGAELGLLPARSSFPPAGFF